MKIFNSISDLQFWRRTLPSDLAVGFVPTMGALHEGHLNLLEISRRDTDLTVLSIFVNPTQFNSPDDFRKYPSNLDADFKMAENAGVDAIFLPTQEMMYPDDYRYKVIESHLSKELCGRFRQGHFDGVLTIVLKLFNIVQPHRAYFGEKDFQQYLLIKEMVSSFFLPIELISVPTVREQSGLAMSSRNLRLSPEGRKRAALIYQILISISEISTAQKKLIENGFEVEYLEDFHERRFVAAHLEGVRLIDNVSVPSSSAGFHG